MNAKWIDFGMKPYGEIYGVQERLAALRREGRIEDTILIGEHLPIVNFGSAKSDNRFSREFLGSLQVPDQAGAVAALANRGIDFMETSRGGGATYIGPGQIVVYPIIMHRRIFGQDSLNSYKAAIDRLMQSFFREHGIDAEIAEVERRLRPLAGARPDRKDVWVTLRGKPHKIGAKGIRFSGDVALHGFSVYINEDATQGFRYIDPCGYTKEELGVTTMEQLLGRRIEIAAIKRELIEKILNGFKYDSIEEEDGFAGVI
jgi:lipoyl(octanoyl) transferase